MRKKSAPGLKIAGRNDLGVTVAAGAGEYDAAAEADPVPALHDITCPVPAFTGPFVSWNAIESVLIVAVPLLVLFAVPSAAAVAVDMTQQLAATVVTVQVGALLIELLPLVASGCPAGLTPEYEHAMPSPFAPLPLKPKDIVLLPVGGLVMK
jgi:hypothetical protein